MLKKRSALTMLSAMVCAIHSLSANPMNQEDPQRSYLYTSYPVKDSVGLQLNLGIIYEQMRVGNAVAAESVIETDTLHIPSVPQDFINYNGVNQRFNFDMAVGLKAGVAYFFEPDGWLLSANVEWLSAQTTYAQQYDGITRYFPTDYPAVFSNVTAEFPLDFQAVNANFNIDYYLLDVVLSNGSYFSGAFTFEPFGGIQTSWINYYTYKQFSRDSNNSAQTNANTNGMLPANRSWVKLTNINFWGCGPEFGLNANYYLVKGFSVYSTLQLAILLGQTTLGDSTGIVENNPSTPTFQYMGDTNNLMSPTTRAILGLQYDANMCNDTQHLKIRAGFDTRFYFNQHPVVRYENQFLYDRNVTSNELYQYEITRPRIEENNTFSMVGLIVDVTYDF